MRTKIVLLILTLQLLQLCLGIYIPTEEVPKPAYTAGIKTTYRKPSSPKTLQNYSKVIVHNRPDSSGARYVVTHEQKVQNVFPIYNAHSYGQRPQQGDNILQTRSHKVINASRGFSTNKPNRTIIKRKIETKTLEIYEKCPTGATGQFIYSLSCNQFLNCWKGRGTIQNCAPGTLFNPKTLECDFPDKVECVTGPTSNVLQNLRVVKSIDQASCPEGFSGIIPDYFDCSKFINCDNGKPNKMDCAPGTLFDMNKNMCDYPDKCTCFNGQNVIDIRAQPNPNPHYVNNYDGYNIQTPCNHQTRNCAQTNTGSNYQQITTNFQDGYSTNTHQINDQHRCNPAVQNCKQGVNGYNQNTYEQSGTNYNYNYNYLQKCNPLTEHCSDQGIVNTNDLTNQGGCNPRTQNCANNLKPNLIYTQRCTSNGNCAQGQTTVEEENVGQQQTIDYEDRNVNIKTTYCDPSNNQNCKRTNAVNNQHHGYVHNQNNGQQNYNQNENWSNQQTGRNDHNRNNGQSQPNYHKICNLNDNSCRQQPSVITTQQVTNTQPVCPHGLVGMHKHPTDCKKFLQCGSGQTFVMDCAPGTLFNAKTGMCDFPYNVQCETTAGQTDESTNQQSSNWGQSVDQQSQGSWSGHQQNNWGQNTNIKVYPATTTSTERSHWGQQTNKWEHSGANWDQSTNNWNHNTVDNHRGSPVTPTSTERSNWGQHSNQQTNNRGHSSNNWGQQIDNDWGQQTDDNWDKQYPVTESTTGFVSRPSQRPLDYDDIYNPNDVKGHATTARSSWPPPYQVNDNDIGQVDYVFTYDDGTPVTLEADNIFVAQQKRSTNCEDSDFRCTPKLCISLTMVCNGVRDCVDGKDELNCQEYTRRFSVTKNSKLVVVENQRWLNVTHSTCSLLCIQNTKFTCRSFTYDKRSSTCYLSDKNIGLSGALQSHNSSDYYELKDGSVDCSDKSKYFECSNKKCLTKDYLCDGYDDCGNREDEKHCSPDKFGYKIALAGSQQKHEGRVEVTAFGSTGYICDDGFGIQDANVICIELGFELGAAEIKGQSQFAKDLHESSTLYMIDDLNCRGNESSIIDCEFPGWGVHNCRDQEIAGVVCKTPQEKCSNDSWKCDSGNECIPFEFVCDGVEDCLDNSDEKTEHCDGPTELRLVGGKDYLSGRVEIKYNGIWGTVCDDDFNDDAAKVVCKNLGYKGIVAVKKEAYFGAGTGPIWMDQVSCFGNETGLQECTHWNWGENNCEHSEDVGVICSNDLQDIKIERHSNLPIRIESGLPENCGYRKDNQFAIHDAIQARVIGGGVAKKGDYPWQAALKVKVKEKSAHWCGAIIISSKWVLTAAHCLQGYTKGAYVIVAGDYNTEETEGTEQQKYIDEFFIHEKFRKGHKLNNDIALIKVKGSGFELNDHIQPICLADSSTNYNRDLNCTISGFGSVKSGVSAYSRNLLAAWIPVQSQDICKMPHVYGEAVTDNMICAGSMEGGLDACDGDSGGPLACLDQGVFTLYGITSWGQHCGYANKPGVYVKVGNYKEWIEDVVSKHAE
ncbi:unnamed protein product [Phyllotreta striolata]|uniref:Uncharacterized protein n=1 Tax=Phyllotreta striolata TaxID=444603 RepID=A0A9N9XUF4_PHYSR|nr:unnamed protein product [Phyllotreta striolata]